MWVELVRGWLSEPDVGPEDLAVLARVNSLLLAPQVALFTAGVPVAAVKAEVALGLDPVDVQDVAAIAAIAMTHATVLARRAETDAGSIFNDSPVSSFPAV